MYLFSCLKLFYGIVYNNPCVLYELFFCFSEINILEYVLILYKYDDNVVFITKTFGRYEKC